MTNKSESIVPMFSYLTHKGSRVTMDELIDPDDFFHMCEPKDVEISLDNGTNWATMEEVREALELLRDKRHEEESRYMDLPPTMGGV